MNFKGLFEGQEIEKFLQQFVNADNPSMPNNIEEALNDVKSIWEEEGFITPAELKTQLIVKYLGDNPDPKLVKLIKNIELSRNSGEKVTGYLGREHAYLATALAHLYSREMDDPIAITEIDFSNMGGTNLHFKKLLAKELNVELDDVKDFKANALTDEAALVIARKIIHILEKHTPEDTNIVPIRSGGDELRIFFTGVKSPQKLRKLNDWLHAAIESATARMGLHDHVHLKAPKNPIRNGFGAALTIKDMAEIDNPETIIHELDAEIKSWKYILGKIRHGELDETFASEEIKHLIDSGILEIEAGQDREEFVKTEVEKMQKRMKSFSQVLHAIKPDESYTIEKFHEYVEGTLGRLEGSHVPAERLAMAVDAGNVSDDNLLLMQAMLPLKDRRKILADEFLSDNDVCVSALEKELLYLALEDLSPKDPSSGALLPEEIVSAIKSYREDINEFANMTGCEEANPYMMGVSFHGLAAMNEVFGHHVADVFLKHLVSDVIEKSIAEEVANKEQIKDASYVAHHGGGNFSVLLKPVDVGFSEKPITFSEEKVAKISKNIETKIEELNNVRVDEFFFSHGIRLDKALLKAKRIKTFADLEDTKEREFFFEDKMFVKKINGVCAVSSYNKIFENERRGAARILSDVRDTTDEKLEMLRACVALKEEIEHPTVVKKLSNDFRV